MPIRLRSRLPCSLVATLAIVAAPVSAQSYPAKPIRVVQQYAPPATADTLTRIVAGILQDGLGQPVVVENRPQSGGVAAAEMVARSAPDGYTLLVAGASTQVIRAHLVRNSSFDPVKDFTPVAALGESPAIIVAHPSGRRPRRDRHVQLPRHEDPHDRRRRHARHRPHGPVRTGGAPA